MPAPQAHITEVTRRKIYDAISLSGKSWSGQLDEVEFLSRLYDLSNLPSYDPRFPDAAGDIYQHRINNPNDWPDNWVFTDKRFDLQKGDSPLLDFLAEMLHPVVRNKEREVEQLLSAFNGALLLDGIELYQGDWISGHPVYRWRIRDTFHGATPNLRLSQRELLTDPSVLEEHLNRIRDGLIADPPASISSSKNLLESLFRIVLDHSEISYSTKDDIPRLYRLVADLLELEASSVPENVRASKTSQQILRTLVTTVNSLAEFRNELGIAHGKSTKSVALARHARLALNSTVSIAEFVLDTWQARVDSGSLTLNPESSNPL